MMDLDRELWRLGIPSKTRHNEVAPAQFEMAPIFEKSSIAADHNMIVMELMRRVALRHGLVCLLHEKPFAGINGNGKHNNWSMATDEDENLLEPGNTPHENAQFLVFLVATIAAVDKYAELLRIGISGPGQRPPPGRQRGPAGDHLACSWASSSTTSSCQLEKGAASRSKKGGTMELGVSVLPQPPQGRHGPQPHLAFRLHRQQVRVPRGRLHGRHLLAPTRCSTPSWLRCVGRAWPTSWRRRKRRFQQGAWRSFCRRTSRSTRRSSSAGTATAKSWHKEAAKRGLPNLKNTAGRPARHAQEGIQGAFRQAQGAQQQGILRAARRSCGSATSRS